MYIVYPPAVPYFSGLRGRAVLGPSGDRVATLADLAVVPGEQFPVVGWAILRTPSGEQPIRWADLTTEIGHYRVRVPLDQLVMAGLPAEALRLGRDLLDRQIVDTHGAKVVRVNDLQLETLAGQLRLVGADAGVRGLLRRIGAERLADGLTGLFRGRLPRGIVPWNLVQPIDTGPGGPVRLTVPHARLALLHPADIADIVEDMTADERRTVFEQLDLETAAEALAEVEPDLQVEIMGDLDRERAADILEEMAPDEATDLLQDLPDGERDDLVGRMHAEEGDDARQLLAYPEDSAGGIMTTDFVALDRELSAAGAIDRLRELQPEPELAYYLYVTDADGRLDGVVSLRDLVVAAPATPLAELMDPHVLQVAATTPKEDVAALIAKYDLLAVPVIDGDRRLLGAVTVDDVVELMLPRRWKKRSLRSIAR